MSTTFRFFVQCNLGLERLLQGELVRLGLLGPTPEERALPPGGVEVRTDQQGMWAICLQSRLAESVRLRLNPFDARDFDTFQALLRKLPFRAFLAPGTVVSVRAHCQRSALWHSGAVVERAVRVLQEHVQLTVASEAPQEIFIRLNDDEVQVSLDVSGARLSRRGYREHVEKASLRESLAAALLEVVEQGSVSTPFLWDPFCGAGTIVLEALHAAHGHLAGGAHSFAFERLRNHDPAGYAEFKQAIEQQLRTLPPWPSLRAMGSDVSSRAIAAASHNAVRAGIAEHVKWRQGDVRQVIDEVPHGAFVVTNPPYGKRLAASPHQERPAGARSGRMHPAVFHLLTALQGRPDLRPVIALVGGDARKALPKNAPALFRTKNGGLSVSARLLTKPLRRSSF